MSISRVPKSPMACTACPVRTLTLYGPAPALASDISKLRLGTRQLGARRILYREGEPVRHLFTLFDGWAIRFKMLPDGRRQVLAVLLPGDPICLPSLWTDRLDFSVQTLTPVSLCVFDRLDMAQFLQSRLDLEWRLGGLLAREVAMLEQRLAYLGRCTAQERVARLIVNIHTRLAERTATGLSFDFPLRQQHIGDALGLTAVHVSRVLRDFRGSGLIERHGGKLTICDYDGLLAVAAMASAEKALAEPRVLP